MVSFAMILTFIQSPHEARPSRLIYDLRRHLLRRIRTLQLLQHRQCKRHRRTHTAPCHNIAVDDCRLMHHFRTLQMAFKRRIGTCLPAF